MTLEYLSELFFTLSFFIYAAALISYLLIVFNKADIIKNISFVVLLLGFVSHTLGLTLRWIIAGINHPPMTNLYESMVFFIWGVVLVYLYIDRKYKIHFAAVFVIIFVLVGMGIASISGNKEIEPLVPALQSWWLHFHVFFASFSYGLFLISAVFSILYLIKAQTNKALISLMFDVFAFFCLLVVGGKSIFLLEPFGFNKVIEMYAQVTVSDEIGYIPGLRFFLLVSALLFALNIFLHVKDSIGTKSIGRYLKITTTVCSLAYLGFVLWVFVAFFTTKEISFSSNPYKLGIILLGLSSVIINSFLFYKYDLILSFLKREDLLEQLGYKTIIVSFPLLTLVIVTGSVWAHYAWGRYWGWDPKETWSLITWLIYATYLHLRLQKGWKGQKLAYVSLIGFFSVIFTYLGVNILLSGLHSYGQA